MANHEFVVISFILVYGVTSLPWPREVGNSNSTRTVDEAKAPGGWMRGRRPAFSNSSRASLSSMSPEGIVFPDDISDGKGSRFLPLQIPEECKKGRTFCESVPDYPSSHVDNILQNGAVEFRSMFGNDYIKDDILHRIDNPDESPLCASAEQMVFPKTAKNKNDKWMFVVNHGDHKQGVRIETCLNQGGSEGDPSCFFTTVFPIGYRTSCKQKYIYRKLLAINENGDPVSDTFQLPSCCSCVILKSEKLSSRVANPLNKEEVPSLQSKLTDFITVGPSS